MDDTRGRVKSYVCTDDDVEQGWIVTERTFHPPWAFWDEFGRGLDRKGFRVMKPLGFNLPQSLQSDFLVFALVLIIPFIWV